MKDMLSIGVGLIAVAVAVWQMWVYMGQKPNDVSTTHLIIAIAAIVVAVVCGIFFMLGRVNKQEEIHITK
jgi:heme/copper-type cytochrome/quinol oxidase subunit 4